ncbi:MAG: ECF transporter S component [Bacteroidales bacterium]|jgi:hypothetical protein|nr:ECF transporter S component [Bacteroidales bacterium]
MNSTVKFHLLSFGKAKTYFAAMLFIVGNIALPKLFHLFPQGGSGWLPIYFFTLIAAYKYGWKVGLLTAVFSPLLNHVLFGMPVTGMLPIVLTKSLLLAGVAGFASLYFKKVSIGILTLVVIFYQALGMVGEWAIAGNFYNAWQSVKIGLPGMLLQIFGGYFVIKSNIFSKYI